MLGYPASWYRWGLSGWNSNNPPAWPERYSGASAGYATTTTEPNTVAPTISGVNASMVTGATAKIMWKTTKDSLLGSTPLPATSLVSWGTSPGGPYPNLVKDRVLHASHTVNLAGLPEFTQIYYRVTSYDGYSTGSTSGEFSFKTTDATAPKVTNVTGNNTTISASYSDPTPSSGLNLSSVEVKVDGKLVEGCNATATGVSCPTPGGLAVGFHSTAVAVRDNAYNTGSGNGTTTITLADSQQDKIAPVTSDNAPTDWQNANFTVKLACNDNSGGSGCKETYYSVDDGPNQLGNEVHIVDDGDHIITYHLIDKAGRVEAEKSVHAKLDKSTPQTSDNAPSAWQNADVTVQLACTDNTSGCKATHYSIDGGPDQLGNEALIDSEGDHTITYHSVDNAGNSEADKSVHVMLDKSAPATTDDAPTGWQNTDFTVQLACVESLEGSGCRETHYSVDGGPDQLGNEVIIDSEGDHSITYRSMDNAGNVEPEKSVHARLDKTEPETTNNAPAGWQNADFTVNFSCTDNSDGSGCKETHYTLDGGSDQLGNEVLINSEGEHTIAYYSIDNAGKVEAEKSIQVLLDKTPPVLSNIKPNGPVEGSSHTIEVDLTDNGSGVDADSVTVNLDGADVSGCNIADGHVSCLMSDLAKGSHSVAVSASDIGGNIATALGSFSIVREYYWTWYDSQNMQNWVLIANPAAASSDLEFELTVAGKPQSLGDMGFGPGVISAGKVFTPSYPGLMDGPVKAVSKTGGKAIASQRIHSKQSIEEVIGFDSERLSNHYYWSWYDDLVTPGMLDWVLIANPDPVNEVSYEVKLGGQTLTCDSVNPCPEANATGVIASGQKIIARFPGRQGGPLEVVASGPVLASQRVHMNFGTPEESFNETVGVPAEELSDHYWWTWYDDSVTPGMLNWLLVANPNDQAVSYEIRVAGELMESGTLEPAGSKYAQGRPLDIATPRFAGTRGGPVEVIAYQSDSDTPANVIASQRVHLGSYINEVMGTVLN